LLLVTTAARRLWPGVSVSGSSCRYEKFLEIFWNFVAKLWDAVIIASMESLKSNLFDIKNYGQGRDLSERTIRASSDSKSPGRLFSRKEKSYGIATATTGGQ